MTEKELVDLFLLYEEKNSLFDWNINGIKIWQYVRFSIFEEIRCIYFNISKSFANPPQPSFSGTMSPSIIFDKYISRNIKFRGRKDVLIVSHPRKIIDQSNYYRDIYTCWLDSELTLSHLVLDLNTRDGDYILQKSHNILTHDYHAFAEKNKLTPSSHLASKNDVLRIVIRPLESLYGITISTSKKNRLLSYINFVLAYKDSYECYYTYVINKIHPRVVILPVGYGTTNQFLISVAHKNGIPVIELEHGSATESHVAYNYSRKMNLESFPDYFFSFGTYNVTKVRWPIDNKNVIPVGFPELERNIKSIPSSKITIVFISCEFRIMDNMVRELYDLLDKSKYQIIYKLHPKEMKDYQTLVSPTFWGTTVEVVHNLDKSLYDCLSQASWVVGMSSTALYEATAFDTKVAIIDHIYSAFSKPLYETGKALLVNDMEHLARCIKENSFIPNKDISFFERNSINKMDYNIHKIVCGSTAMIQ